MEAHREIQQTVVLVDSALHVDVQLRAEREQHLPQAAAVVFPAGRVRLSASNARLACATPPQHVQRASAAHELGRALAEEAVAQTQ